VSVARAEGGTHTFTWSTALAGWRGHLASAAAGGVATLGQAPFYFVPAFVIGITVLVWRLDAAYADRRPRLAAFATGWWFAFGYFVSGLYWVASAFVVDGMGLGAGIGGVLLLAGGLALLFWGPAFALAIPFWTRDWRRIAVFAAAATGAEFARGHLFGGFPWNLPAYVWNAGEPVSQLASVLGAYGLSAFTLLIAAAPATLLDRNHSLASRFAPIIAAALALGLAWGAGLQRLSAAPTDSQAASPIVRVADPGISQRDKWQRRPDQEWRVLAAYAAASGAPQESRANVVVWPEGAIPVVNFFLLENPVMLDAIGRMLGDRALILGFSRYDLDRAGGALYFNSAAVLDGVSGQVRLPDATQIYDKHRLVPFGEFIPLWSLISGANIAPLQQRGAGFTPGQRPSRLVVPDAPRAVVLICYEAIFPGLVPRGAERPGWIVSLTNDAWFGAGTGPWQHYNMARYRAIEEGLPLARAASGGISAIVDAYGRPVAETRMTGGAAEARLPPALPNTLYAQWGQLLAALVFFAILALRFAPAREASTGSQYER
jgi:apolipoprotein N-acyltransferase